MTPVYHGSHAEPGAEYGFSMDGIGHMTENEQEWFEERAAIAEFDCGWPRPIAEAEARRMIGARRWVQRICGTEVLHAIAAQSEPDIESDMSASRGQ